ncbi:ankyrin repeat domain-containing protein [Pseudoxanthomonas winnipegensis]|uniref:ankyrin repeat domain-containing protein n=1 Tax=Pseudoxanthomonas winnipegensis TaxID=2480810 RepID=UPI00103DAA18|nr:ankyrin repeat domain-containing protein [Pseudoxanthomonas winnipegensis]TBV69750.1 hypothetical protein EYC45_19060 [Pseudoxanthomonas winnipegensis]
MRLELRMIIRDIRDGDICGASERLEGEWSDDELGEILNAAAECGEIDLVNQSLSQFGHPEYYTNDALQAAAKNGHLDCVRILIPVSDPKDNSKTSALVWASANGHLECVKELIPVSDAKEYGPALVWASRTGHVDCVKELIPVRDPKACDSLALRYAAKFYHTECVKELLPHSDPERAIRSCINNGWGWAESADLIRECAAELQSNLIHAELGTQPDMQPRKARRM